MKMHLLSRRLLLFVAVYAISAMVVVVSATTTTTTTTTAQSHPHRVLETGTTAELVLIEIEYGPDPDDESPEGKATFHSEEIWELHLSDSASAKLGGLNDIEVVHFGNNFIDDSSSSLQEPPQPGDLIILHESIILVDNKVHIPREANIEFLHTEPDGTTTITSSQSSDRVQEMFVHRIHADAKDDAVEDVEHVDIYSSTNGGNMEVRPAHVEDERDKDNLRGSGGEGESNSAVTVSVSDGVGAVAAAEVDPTTHTRTRKLSSHGVHSVLVVRVTDSENKRPPMEVSQLVNDVFEDASALNSQYEGCSHGKLRFVPYVGTTSKGRKVDSGVTTLQVDYVANQGYRGDFQTATQNAMKAQISNNINSEVDHIMYCLPKGTFGHKHNNGTLSNTNWLAVASVGGQYSFYNDVWCSYVSAQLHEVGHNLGLMHSGIFTREGIDKNTYGDTSGMMGSSVRADDTKSCFNPAKSWQLGWYEDQTLSLNPLNLRQTGDIRRLILNGVSDYGANRDNGYVVVQLEQKHDVYQGNNTNGVAIYRPEHYFLGYNRAAGINSETGKDGDKVTIVLKIGDGQSKRVAALSLGESYTIEGFNHQGNRDVTIRFVGLSNDEDDDNYGRDATIDIIDVKNYEAPAPPQNNCRTYKVFTTTDGYPADNEWSIIEKGGTGEAFYLSPNYDGEETQYTQEVCLPYDKCYTYTITDQFGDGICCQQGDGGFKIEDENTPPNIVLGGGKYPRVGSAEDLAYKLDILFCTGADPNPSDVAPDPGPTQPVEECEDLKGKIKYRPKNKKPDQYRATNCNRVAEMATKEQFCRFNYKGPDTKYQDSKIRDLCPEACGTC